MTMCISIQNSIQDCEYIVMETVQGIYKTLNKYKHQFVKSIFSYLKVRLVNYCLNVRRIKHFPLVMHLHTHTHTYTHTHVHTHTHTHTHWRYTWTFPLAARSKAWVCGPLLVEIVGSNPIGGLDACLL